MALKVEQVSHDYVKCLGKVFPGNGNCMHCEYAFGSYLFTISHSYNKKGKFYCKSSYALVPSLLVKENRFVSTGTPILSDFIIHDNCGLEILANCLLLHSSAI